jgi:hypothetical protein
MVVTSKTATELRDEIKRLVAKGARGGLARRMIGYPKILGSMLQAITPP